MANYKKHPNRNRRAHCHMCKYWKDFGFKKHGKNNEKFSDFKRWDKAGKEIKEYRILAI